jgi:hypothetical protein
LRPGARARLTRRRRDCRSETASLKIADFGFARHLSEAAMAETLCGSPLYMAPEILRHERYDAKADLWSVGTILYEMLVGRPPFGGANPHELLMNIERSELRIPPSADASPDALDLCVRLAGAARLPETDAGGRLRKLLRVRPTERVSFQEFFSSPYLSATASPVAAAATAAATAPALAVKDGVTGLLLQASSSSSSRSSSHSSSHSSNSYASSPSPSRRRGAANAAEGELGGGPAIGDNLDDGEPGRPASRGTPLLSSRSATPKGWEMVEDKPAGMPPPPPVAAQPPSAAAGEGTEVVEVLLAKPARAARNLDPSGRALTFAVHVGERAVLLAQLAERVVDVWYGEQWSAPGDEAQAAAGLVVESMRLLSLACLAADDAVDAAQASSAAAAGLRAGQMRRARAVSLELRAWFQASKDKADKLLGAATAAATGARAGPGPRRVLLDVALVLGKRAAGHQLLQGEPDLQDEEDLALGLMLLQVLSVADDGALAHEDRRALNALLALFTKRCKAIQR